MGARFSGVEDLADFSFSCHSSAETLTFGFPQLFWVTMYLENVFSWFCVAFPWLFLALPRIFLGFLSFLSFLRLFLVFWLFLAFLALSVLFLAFPGVS